MVESLLKEFPNVLILRVRMPIVEDLTYPRNFITKILKYDKVHARHEAFLRDEARIRLAWK